MLNMFNEYTYGNAMRKQVGNKRIVGFPGKNEPSFHTCISIFISFLIKLRFCMFLYVVVLTVRPVVSASDQYKPTVQQNVYHKMLVSNNISTIHNCLFIFRRPKIFRLQVSVLCMRPPSMSVVFQENNVLVRIHRALIHCQNIPC